MRGAISDGRPYRDSYHTWPCNPRPAQVTPPSLDGFGVNRGSSRRPPLCHSAPPAFRNPHSFPHLALHLAPGLSSVGSFRNLHRNQDTGGEKVGRTRPVGQPSRSVLAPFAPSPSPPSLPLPSLRASPRHLGSFRKLHCGQETGGAHPRAGNLEWPVTAGISDAGCKRMLAGLGPAGPLGGRVAEPPTWTKSRNFETAHHGLLAEPLMNPMNPSHLPVISERRRSM